MAKVIDKKTWNQMVANGVLKGRTIEDPPAPPPAKVEPPADARVVAAIKELNKSIQQIDTVAGFEVLAVNLRAVSDKIAALAASIGELKSEWKSVEVEIRRDSLGRLEGATLRRVEK